MRVDRLLGEMRIPRDSVVGRREFERQMEERRRLDTREEIKQMRRGWYLGDEEFRRAEPACGLVQEPLALPPSTQTSRVICFSCGGA